MNMKTDCIKSLVTVNAVYAGTASGVMAGGLIGDYGIGISMIGILLFVLPGLIVTLLCINKMRNSNTA